MDAILPYAVWLSIILTILGLAAIAAFGIRSLAFGKISMLSVIVVGLPLILCVVLGLVMGEWARAAILTALILAGVAAVGVAVFGIRSAGGF